MQRRSISEARRAAAIDTVTESVTVALLSGEVRLGRVGRFSPTSTDLVLVLDDGVATIVPAETIAYIGFHNSADAAPESGVGRATERFKIHTSGGVVFVVDAKADQLRSPLGFAARPAGGSSPFRRLYFYAHGVLGKEKDVPLGEMLLESGALGPQSLREGVAAQETARNAPIGTILVESGEVDPASLERAANLQARRKMRIGQILVEAGLVSSEAIDRALAEQKLRKGKRLGEVLVELGLVRESDLTITLSAKFQMPFVDLDQTKADPAAAELLPREIITRFGVLPLSVTPAALTVAIGDPLAVDAIDAVRSHVKRRRVEEVLAMPSQLVRHVDALVARIEAKAAQASAAEFDALLHTLKVEELKASAETEEEDEHVVKGSDADGGIVRLVNQIIIDAYKRGASDIHIEPNGKERNVTVRFRIDGECVVYQEVPATWRAQILARVKIMASLDISERRKPQDGKIRFQVGDRTIELRVATLPTVGNCEDAVLRVLASSKPLPLERMGLSDRNLHELQAAIAQPYGLVLCVGPTGSGKTTTLHSALGSINTGTKKIWTAEDPVEITQPGLRQMQVNAKVGLTFAAAMRSFLRADPDVIMVGEMRDEETASIAVEASLTGHLVFSTLHTNSAPETVTRLLDMGLDPFSFADSLLAILAQRLTRALCRACREPVTATPEDYAELAGICGAETLARLHGIEPGASFQLHVAKGCNACGGTGYKGRLALHELLVTTPDIRQAIARRAPISEIRAFAAGGGMTSLAVDGVGKVLKGLTDLKQVLAVAAK